jgi:hypothetical protein
MHSTRSRVLNVRVSNPEMAMLATIAGTLAQRNRNPYPDKSSAIRYSLELVGRLIGRNLLDHVEALLAPKGAQ